MENNKLQELTQKLYNDGLEKGRSEADRLVAEAKAQAAKILADANAEAEAIRQKAAADIAQEKKKALNDAKDEISGMAVAIAEKVVGRHLDVQDQQRLVDEFIDALGEDV